MLSICHSRAVQRTGLIVAGLLYLLAVLGLPAPAAAQEVNLLTNGGFESGTFDGWTRGRAADGIHPVIKRDGGAHSGDAWLWCRFADPCARSAGVMASAGASYTLRLWLKPFDNGDHGAVRLRYDGEVVRQSVSSSWTYGIWQEVMLTYTAPAAKVIEVELVGGYYTEVGFDDVSLLESAAASPAPSSSPAPTSSPSATPDDTGKVCYRAAQALKNLLQSGNIPYCWGSNTPGLYQPDLIGDKCPTGSGLDCSGSFIWAYNQAGAGWSDATAATLWTRFEPVPNCTLADISCMAVGDAVFLSSDGTAEGIYHIAMYLGGGLWGDCYNTGTGCQVWDVRNKAAYQTQFFGVGRPSARYGWEPCSSSTAVGGGGGGLFGFDIWSPVRWLWDRISGGLTTLASTIINGVRDLLLPTPEDWALIRSELDRLAQREPMGTVRDLAAWIGSFRAALQAGPQQMVDAVAPEQQAAAGGSAYAPLLRWLSPTGIVASGGAMLGRVADNMPAAVMLLIKSLTTCMIMMGLFVYIRARMLVAG